MRHLLLLCLIVVLQNSLYAQDKRNADWREDIEFLKKELPQKHIHLFHQLDKSTFDNDLDAIVNQIDDLDDLSIAIKLQQVIAKAGDSHTSVAWERYARSYVPKNQSTYLFEAYWFKDGIYVLSTKGGDKPLVGGRLQSIGGIPIATIVDSVKTLFVAENEALVKLKTPHLIARPQVLQYFGFVGDETSKVDITIVDEAGNTMQHRAKFKYSKPYAPYSTHHYLTNGKRKGRYEGWFLEDYMMEKAMYYVQYNRCFSKELANRSPRYKKQSDKMPSFNAFSDKVLQTLRTDSIDKFVFDMRYNGGGNSNQGSNLISKIAEIKRINKQGKIYVLIGRKTFSSAILNTLDFLKETDAILVGEATAGKASHFGEVRSLELPNSQLKVYYSVKYFLHTAKKTKTYFTQKSLPKQLDTMMSIEPNYTVELTFEDYKNKVDPVLEWIEKQ